MTTDFIRAELDTPESDESVQINKFKVADLPELSLSRPIYPELVTPDKVRAPQAYKRFRDMEIKEEFRERLVAEIEEPIRQAAPTAGGVLIDKLHSLFGQIREQGAVVLADIVDSLAFQNLVDLYGSIMQQEGSGSFIHRFVDLRRTSEMLTDEKINQPLVHPLMIALISYAVGGPIRIVDARAKDAEPLSVLAQDNMLHIDNTPFNDEYKILVTWQRGTTKGPEGQNFTFLPSTHKLARNCFINSDGVAWSSEFASLFLNRDLIKNVFEAQKALRSASNPTVVEVTDSNRPLSSVFAAGSLVHHRFRTATGKARSCVIIAFHRVADNPGRLVNDMGDSPDASLSELLISGTPDATYEQRFLASMRANASMIADLLSRWINNPENPVPLHFDELPMAGQRFEEWMAASTQAPRVEEIRQRQESFPGTPNMSRSEFFEFVWRLMRFDKHGPIDLILYADNHEEPRKWARNLIREMPADRLRERLNFWGGELEQPNVSHALNTQEVSDLVYQVLEEVDLSDSGKAPSDWQGDLKGMNSEIAGRSVKQLLKDLAETTTRCESVPSFLYTSVFIFWAVDTAYSLDGRRNEKVYEIAANLLRHYVVTALSVLNN